MRMIVTPTADCMGGSGFALLTAEASAPPPYDDARTAPGPRDAPFRLR